MIVFAFLLGCSSEKSQDSASISSSEYVVPDPTDEMLQWLMDTPVYLPYQKCTPYEDGMDIAEEDLILDEDGSLQVCIWNHVSGAVPEGFEFTDFGTCEVVWTQGPSWFYHPEPLFESDPALLEDDAYMAEVEWARQQGKASGCGCCHSSDMSGYASRWDYDAPGIWTDTMPLTGIVMAAGLASEHALFGYWPEDDNHGFNREELLIPTTDIERMKNFFLGEFERRGGTNADIAVASEQFLTVNFQLFEEPTECISPFEGMDEDGRIVWNGPTARQIYVQEVGSVNPGFLPNFDLPEGTIWALYASVDSQGFESGVLKPGEVPSGAIQQIPADGTKPTLEPGKQYRLFVTPDIMVLRHANCIFTYSR